MKSFRKIASLTAVLVCTIAPSFGQHLAPSSVSKPTPAERAVIDLEHRWISNEYNPAFLSSILADDFLHVLPQGIITKQEQIAYVSTHPQPKFKVHRFLKLQVRSYGNTAIANGLVLSVPVSGPPRRFLFTDVFVLLNGHWQAVNSQENPASKQ